MLYGYLSYQNYDGMIGFYNLKQKFVNGWLVENGEVIRKILPVTDHNNVVKQEITFNTPLIKNKLAASKKSSSISTTENINLSSTVNCSYGTIDTYGLACVGAGNGYSIMSRIYDDPGYYEGCTPYRTGFELTQTCNFYITPNPESGELGVGSDFSIGGFDGISIDPSEEDKEEKKKECKEQYGADAYIDSCGTCVGGTTGLKACNLNDLKCKLKYGLNATWSEECNTCIGGTTGIESCPPKEIKIDSNVRPCVNTIATTVISKASEIKNVLSNLLSLANVNASAAVNTIANSSTYTITISETTINDRTKTDSFGNSYIERTNGTTHPTTGNININSLMLNDATNLGVAATIIHEIMHAYFVYGIHHTSGDERLVFADMNHFLYEKNGNPQANQGNAQHTQMAVTYVNSMASILQKYAISQGIINSPDSNISLTDYCRDIFWQNLSNTQSYQAAPNKTRAEANGKREYTNTSNSSKKKDC